MVSLEQVKLLETKVAKTIEYVKKVTEENAAYKGKLNSYQQRIDELEVLIKQFKEDQSRIEDAILSALDRLNQFEDALESKLTEENPNSSEIRSMGKKKDEPMIPVTPPFIDEPDEEFDDSDSLDFSDPEDPPELSEPQDSKKPQSPENELDIF